jgi:putative membrane protein
VIVIFSVGIVGMVFPFSREFFKSLTPIILILSLALVYVFHSPYGSRFWLVSALIFLLGFFSEVIGVGTGLVFGSYQYGDTLGIKIFHTPLMIGINWLLLVYCSSYIAGRFVDSLYFRSIVSAALMVVYDFALEPSAIYLDMWSWEGNAVPLQNYLAWGIIAFGLNYLAGAFRFTAKENKMVIPVFFIQLVFFIVLDIWIFIEKAWG